MRTYSMFSFLSTQSLYYSLIHDGRNNCVVQENVAGVKETKIFLLYIEKLFFFILNSASFVRASGNG